MYLSKIAANSIEEGIDNDIINASNSVADATPQNLLGRLLLAAPVIAGAYSQRNDRPIEGAAKGAGASLGGYAGYKGGKALADQLEEWTASQNMTPEQKGLMRLAAIAAGTGLGAKLGWEGVGAII